MRLLAGTSSSRLIVRTCQITLLDGRTPLASVDTHRPSYPRSAEDGKYIFPDIAIFCTASSDDRKARYFTMWTHMRDALIYRAFSATETSSVVPLRSQEWRDVLNGDMFKHDAKPQLLSRRGKAKLTKNRTQILSLEQILAPCLAHAGVVLDLTNHPLDMKLPSIAQARASLWEISELNFRLEFKALDKRLHIGHSTRLESREQLVYSCFPGSNPTPFDCAPEHANQGLAAQDWREKLTFLLRLNRVMESWAGYRETRISVLDPGTYNEASVSDLEFRLARFYTQSFFESFGRACCIPMALHVA
ncbi:hypothetical protein MSAN_02528900 [Mycena sanguinolenta]|uniref:Uncharacterized protein n=1 Tax=Mycena sanguinolenta TaxID=230812 RepID=A0A8H6TVW0_9AGAR|nr:hypothetical protein MSAN_02528900 [Mycena sanguinolenta]